MSDAVFDDLFCELVTDAEGQVIVSFGDDHLVYGLPITEAIVRQFLDREPLVARARLVWRWLGAVEGA
jgi:hypothetical protein